MSSSQLTSSEGIPTLSLRGVVSGVLIGSLICFASLYYGLQSGNTNSMPLPSIVLAFSLFKPLQRYLHTPFNPNENVLAMTVAASMGGFPYAAGLAGVIPALEFLVPERDNGPLSFALPRLVLWSLSVCLFGNVIAVMLREQSVVRSKLRFPSGTASMHTHTGGAVVNKVHVSQC